MKPFIWITFSTLAFLSASNLAAANESYICLYGDSERKITINYLDPASKVPCEVVYEKADGAQTLWSAQNEIGYCEAKAEAFIAKQQEWGWDCALMTGANSQ